MKLFSILIAVLFAADVNAAEQKPETMTSVVEKKSEGVASIPEQAVPNGRVVTEVMDIGAQLEHHETDPQKLLDTKAARAIASAFKIYELVPAMGLPRVVSVVNDFGTPAVMATVCLILGSEQFIALEKLIAAHVKVAVSVAESVREEVVALAEPVPEHDVAKQEPVPEDKATEDAAKWFSEELGEFFVLMDPMTVEELSESMIGAQDAQNTLVRRTFFDMLTNAACAPGRALLSTGQNALWLCDLVRITVEVVVGMMINTGAAPEVAARRAQYLQQKFDSESARAIVTSFQIYELSPEIGLPRVLDTMQKYSTPIVMAMVSERLGRDRSSVLQQLIAEHFPEANTCGRAPTEDDLKWIEEELGESFVFMEPMTERLSASSMQLFATQNDNGGSQTQTVGNLFQLLSNAVSIPVNVLQATANNAVCLCDQLLSTAEAGVEALKSANDRVDAVLDVIDPADLRTLRLYAQ